MTEDEPVIPCRCEVLNVMTGAIAVDYARQHLDVVREGAGRVTTYACPDSGVQWVEERAPASVDDSTRRLRRLA